MKLCTARKGKEVHTTTTTRPQALSHVTELPEGGNLILRIDYKMMNHLDVAR